jgi:hypothetical protein
LVILNDELVIDMVSWLGEIMKNGEDRKIEERIS